jgi:hypothetical protein
MTSERKIAANRDNAEKSTGPRTIVGKSRGQPQFRPTRIGGRALWRARDLRASRALGKGHLQGQFRSFRFEQAIIIAETQILVARVRAARIAAIRRQAKKPHTQSRALPGSLTDQELVDSFRDLAEGNVRKVIKRIKRMNREYVAFVKTMATAMTAKNDHDRIAARREADRMIAAREEETKNPDEGDEVECLRRALPELLSLERYERRALSRRKRAIRRFDALGE